MMAGSSRKYNISENYMYEHAQERYRFDLSAGAESSRARHLANAKIAPRSASQYQHHVFALELLLLTLHTGVCNAE